MPYDHSTINDDIEVQVRDSAEAAITSKVEEEDFETFIESNEDEAQIIHRLSPFDYVLYRTRLSRRAKRQRERIAHQHQPTNTQASEESIDDDSSTTPLSPPLDLNQSPTSSSQNSDYSTSRRIPFSKKNMKVFTDAGDDISKSHKDRFPVLVDLFRRNVQQEPVLNNFVGLICYELRMCASTKEDARPSILVFCPKPKLKKLKAVLTKPHLKAQYDPPPSETASHPARFQLLFWAQDVQLLSSATIEYQASARLSVRSLCGSRVLLDYGSDQRYSTLACVLYVNGQGYGLTTNHLLQDHGVSTIPKDIKGLHVRPREEREDKPENYDDNSDDEYDLSEHNHNDLDSEIIKAPLKESQFSNRSERKDTPTRGTSLEEPDEEPDRLLIDYLYSVSILGENERSHINEQSKQISLLLEQDGLVGCGVKCEIRGPPSTPEWEANRCNLDWTLLEIPDKRFWLPNVYSHPDTVQPTAISGICRPTSMQRLVHIVTSSNTSSIGRLEDNMTYIHDYMSSNPARVWTVGQLRDATTLERGTSGALVVDAESAEVLGQVIARSPLGQLYVIPMMDIVDQIQDAFGTGSVSLTPLSPRTADSPKVENHSLNQFDVRTDSTHYDATANQIKSNSRLARKNDVVSFLRGYLIARNGCV